MLQKADVAAVLAAEGQRSRKWRIGMIAVGVAAVALLAVGGWLWWSASTRSPLLDLTSEPAALGDVHVTLVATGTLQPVHQVAVSSTATGTIASLDVDYNETVALGQPLAHLDLSTPETRLARSRAMVDVQKASRDIAAATLADAAAALKRIDELAPGQTVSVRDRELAQTAVQRAQGNLSMAEAQVEAAEADLKGAQDDYAKGTITAPIAGTVLNIAVEVGQTITSAGLGQALFTIASDLKALDLVVDIDEADVVNVTEGDAAAFTVEAAPDQPFAGVVRQIRSSPTAADGVVSYKGLIRVDNSSLTLKPGMTATADIAVNDATGVLTVPSSALRYVPVPALVPKATVDAFSGDHVWVLDGKSVTPVTVTLGITDGQRTEIVAGLKAGDVVITGTKAR